MMYIITPLLYYTDFWEFKSFDREPIGSGLFTKDHEKFNVDQVLKDDATLDWAKWKAKRPLLLTPYCE